MTQANTVPAPPGGAQGVANRHKLMMLAATAARMGVALIGFIVMARFLGPENFGVIATAAAYGAFISIVTDFGLTVSALRTASAEPERVAEILTDAFATKLVLSVGSAIIGLAAALAILPTDQIDVYVMVFAGVLAYAFADLAMVAARARRRFETEAIIVLTTSVAILLIVGGTAAATRSLEATALAFMLTRFFYLVVTLVVLKRRLGIGIGWRRPAMRIAATVRQSSGYAVDCILTSLSSQTDVLLFSLLLTVHDIGVYQAGARLVQVIMPFAAVLSTVYMPTLSAAAIRGQTDRFKQSAKRINIEFCALAVAAGLAFQFLGPIATRLIYGDKYEALVPLWAGFGVFALLRLMAASYGIQLAAMGYIRTRILAQVASIALFCLSIWIAMPHFGLSITSWLLGLSSLPALVISGISLIRGRHADTSLMITLALTLAASAAIALL